MGGWTELLLRRMCRIGGISDSGMSLIRQLPIQLASFGDNQDIVREGSEPQQSFVLIQGLVANYKVCYGGGLQIASLYVPGDMPDLQNLHLVRSDSGFRALTPAQIGFISHVALDDACSKSPELMRLFWRMTLIDAAIYREWVSNIGQRQAPARIAHVFCELFVRLKIVGLVDGWSYQLPLKQEEIAETTGLSTVHVNRAIQKLRRLGLIKFDHGWVSVLNWKRLSRVADFDASYLHLTSEDEGLSSPTSPPLAAVAEQTSQHRKKASVE